jgi:hypothetical protein
VVDFWLTGFPLCFCEKYGKLARTDLKNERISRSGGFQACYEIIRGVVGGLSPALNLSISTSEPHPLGKMSNPAAGRRCAAATPSFCCANVRNGGINAPPSVPTPASPLVSVASVHRGAAAVHT